MPLQDTLDAMRATFESKLPPEVVNIMHHAAEELLQSGIMDRVSKVGHRAPRFALPDHNGDMVDAGDLLSQGPLVVNFYRGLWWPYCNAELSALQEIVPELGSRGAHLVVISPQLEKYSRQVVKKHRLTFGVLSDRGNAVASQFGLTFTLPDQLKELHHKWGMDLERFNGDPSWTLPLPGRFIIDGHGMIIHVDVHPDYTRRPDPTDIVNLLEAMA